MKLSLTIKGLAVGLALAAISVAVVKADDSVSMGSSQMSGMTTPQPTAQATPTHKAKKKSKKPAMKTVWVCPMGDYVGDKPGKCPNCGMDLVKKEVPVDPSSNTSTPAKAQ